MVWGRGSRVFGGSRAHVLSLVPASVPKVPYVLLLGRCSVMQDFLHPLEGVGLGPELCCLKPPGLEVHNLWVPLSKISAHFERFEP